MSGRLIKDDKLGKKERNRLSDGTIVKCEQNSLKTEIHNQFGRHIKNLPIYTQLELSDRSLTDGWETDGKQMCTVLHTIDESAVVSGLISRSIRCEKSVCSVGLVSLTESSREKFLVPRAWLPSETPCSEG